MMKERKIVAKPEHKQFAVAEAKEIGEKLGMNWEAFDVKEFCLGLNTELAAGIYNPVTNFASEDPILIGKVVRDHLNKFPDYYTYWTQRTKEAELVRDSKRISTQPTATARLSSF
jgi:hypothetical protein